MMAAWERSIVHKTWVEVTVNTPCFIGDMHAALTEARAQYYKHTRRTPDSDDVCEILTGDDKITIRFETTEKRVAVLIDGLDADLQQASELLAAVITDCYNDDDGRCTRHARPTGQQCFHSQARDFLTNKEENPHG